MRCAILPPVPVPYREPLFARLAERGRITPRVIYLAGGQPGWDVRPDWFGVGGAGYDIEVLRSWQRPRPGRTPLMLARGLGGALRRFGPDVVVSSEYGPSTWRAMAWCRRFGRRLVVMSELTPWSDAMLSPLQLRVHRLVAPRVDGFVVFSSQGVARLRGMGADPRRVEVSVQSADLERFRAVGARRGASSRPVRVLCVGRLVPDKNFALLIEAFAGCGFAEGEAELELCGTGPLEEELRELAARLGVALRLRGFVAPDDLPAVYASADVFALVSTYEPFGVAVREAAAAGLPVICSERAGAAGDVAVDGENGVVVDPADRAAVTRALGVLVRDHALRARLSGGSLAVTERHPLEADVEAFERAVLRAADGGPRPA